MKCPFYGSTNTNKIRKILSPINNEQYTLWYCKNCELEFFTPLKFDSSVYVEEKTDAYKNFHNVNGRRIPEWTKNVVNILKNKLKIKDLSNKKILKIGAGDCINVLAL